MPYDLTLDFPPPHRCVFPLGHPGDPDFAWCRAPTRTDPPSPYCAEHHAVAYYRVPLKSKGEPK